MSFASAFSNLKFISLATLISLLGGCSSSETVPQNLETVTNSIGMSFLMVPSGKFQMGSTGGDAREMPVHEVTISKDYGLGTMEVTEQQYETVMGKTPNLSKPDNAINSLSWSQAHEFCQRLSELPEEKAAGRKYRLPTEAEWEYACRAGTTSAYSFGDDPTLVGQHAWYARNSRQASQPPGKKIPNPWGFYDMHGNAWEWCQNWRYDYQNAPVTDPSGPATGKTRVLRGGGWFHREPNCRSSARFSEDPNSRTKYTGGLRVALTKS